MIVSAISNLKQQPMCANANKPNDKQVDKTNNSNVYGDNSNNKQKIEGLNPNEDIVIVDPKTNKPIGNKLDING